MNRASVLSANGVEVAVEELTPVAAINRAAASTRADQAACRAPAWRWYRSEHSPIRARWLWVMLQGVPSYVSVHLVRHKMGAEHYVQTHREDLAGVDPREVNRLTPLNHTMTANAQALLTMARDRLCYNADKGTVRVYRAVRSAVQEVDPALARYMVPECSYRNGICPHFRQCAPGVNAVLRQYGVPHKEDQGDE